MDSFLEALVIVFCWITAVFLMVLSFNTEVRNELKAPRRRLANKKTSASKATFPIRPA